MPSDIGKRSIVNFTAKWCSGCKSLKPLLEEARKLIEVTTYDVEENPEKAAEYGVSSLPTVVFLVDGRQWGLIQGNSLRSAKTIKEFSEGK